ncbi:SAM-dependent methyltransferase, partial [Vibrio cholerae]|nr:SAM-dependent methyltransferase [Vibrio cholerae]
HKLDWDSFETSWDFKYMPLLNNQGAKIKDCWSFYNDESVEITQEALELESLVNDIYASNYNLSSESISQSTLELITLERNRYFSSSSDDEFKSSTTVNMITYALGCMMGRYSLDREGLIYAHSGNEGFDKLVAEGAYKTFYPDEDGIIPLTDQEWFKDDATNRFREFVQVVWGEEHLQENLDFVAESLCLNAIKPKKSESALETIRRYLSTQFYKDHLKTYKKRPIYWLFSSGKQKAFECLVYLHRYNEGTLSRMRTEYVTPLLGKYDAYAEQLEKQIETADSTSEANRFKKELDALIKKQVELREFDDKLKHYADMRISLDLDDGVKVNYGKFGDLLADVKAITGSAPEVN